MNTSEVIELVQETVDRIQLPGYGADEVRFMGETMGVLRPQQVWEWGTNRGSSARIFYEYKRYLCPDCVVSSVELEDPRDYHEHPGVELVGWFVRELPVDLYGGDGVTVALAKAAPGLRTLFFIDGNHDPKVVIAELMRVVTEYPTATVLLHDTNHPSVGQYNKTGPALAVDAVLATTDRYEMTELGSQAGMVRLVPR